MFARHLVLARPYRAFLGLILALTAFGASATTASTAIAAALPTDGHCTGYSVQLGDSLASIAAQHGISVTYLAQINHLSSVGGLYPDQSLMLCGDAVTASAVRVSSVMLHATVAATPHASLAAPHAVPSAVLANTDWAGEPCRSTDYATGAIYEWKVPPGCFSGIYWVNPRHYASRSGFGWCNWWPEVLHPGFPNVIDGQRHSRPVPGAVVVFAPGEQGAGSGGHYGEVVAVLGGGWILISEMNNSWRGGFARVNYRYVYQSAGVSYVY